MNKTLVQEFHNPCNTDCINFHNIWKLILVQCECNLSQIWKLAQPFQCCKDYTNSCTMNAMRFNFSLFESCNIL